MPGLEAVPIPACIRQRRYRPYEPAHSSEGDLSPECSRCLRDLRSLPRGAEPSLRTCFKMWKRRIGQ